MWLWLGYVKTLVIVATHSNAGSSKYICVVENGKRYMWLSDLAAYGVLTVSLLGTERNTGPGNIQRRHGLFGVQNPYFSAQDPFGNEFSSQYGFTILYSIRDCRKFPVGAPNRANVEG